MKRSNVNQMYACVLVWVGNVLGPLMMSLKPDPDMLGLSNRRHHTSAKGIFPIGATASITTRHDWSLAEVRALFEQPFNGPLFQVQMVYRAHLDPSCIQISTLLSIKIGTCPGDYKYYLQSGHYNTGLDKEKLMEVQKVPEAVTEAKAIGSAHFCMDAAWKHPSVEDIPYILEMAKGVKKLGLETCMTLGRLAQEQTQALAGAGLDYYNHNLDTSPEFYGNIITAHTYNGRLQTLACVREAGTKICFDGIPGMGESMDDHTGLLIQLMNPSEHLELVPINMLVKVKGTPLAEEKDVDPFDFTRTLATTRIMMLGSHVRLSAGHEQTNEQMQTLVFMAGAGSVFYGEELLIMKNPQAEKGTQLFVRPGIKSEEREEYADEIHQITIEQALVEQRDSQLFYNTASI